MPMQICRSLALNHSLQLSKYRNRNRKHHLHALLHLPKVLTDHASVSEITRILLKENRGLICFNVFPHGLDKGQGNFNYSVHNNPHFLTPAERPVKALVIYNSIITYNPDEFFQALQLKLWIIMSNSTSTHKARTQKK